MNLLLERFLLITAAVILDWFLADREPFTHPVELIGNLIERLEAICREKTGEGRASGLLLAILTLAVSGGLVYVLLSALRWFHPLPAALFSLYIFYSGLAAGSLAFCGRRIVRMLENDNLEGARSEVDGLITRRADDMSPRDVSRAAVETVAENINDAVIAPLLFSLLFGPAGMIIFKAIDTLDSMLGYRREGYLDMGWASARIDDLACWIPARLTAAVLIFAALLPGYSARRSWRTVKRDARSTESPNAGYPEAAMAGALGVRLGGPDYYFGELVEKPYLGEKLRQNSPTSLIQAIKLIYVSEIIFLLVSGYIVLRFAAFLPH